MAPVISTYQLSRSNYNEGRFPRKIRQRTGDDVIQLNRSQKKKAFPNSSILVIE